MAEFGFGADFRAGSRNGAKAVEQDGRSGRRRNLDSGRDRTMRDRDSFVDSDASIHRCTDSNASFITDASGLNRCIGTELMNRYKIITDYY